MADVVDKATRSRMMSGIRGKDTRPEFAIRQGLHARGFRYRLHAGELPGRPDLILPKYRAAIFIHGCFWHGHDCHLFKWPSTRPDFWRNKILDNISRDQRALDSLVAMGWRVGTVWECALRRKGAIELALDHLASWITSDETRTEIKE